MTDLFERAVERLYGHRRWVLLLVQVALVVAANVVAFWLRFDGQTPVEQQPYDFELLPLLIAIRLGVFIPMRLHEGVWRYASIWDLRNIIFGVTLGSVLFFGAVHLGLGVTLYPRSVVIIDAILLTLLMGGVRLSRRLYAASSRSDNSRRILIYGAGDAGELVARDMLVHPERGALPVAFLDDDEMKTGLTIHDIPVLHSSRLQYAVTEFRPDQLLLALPSSEPSTIRRIVGRLESVNLPIKTVPALRDISSKHVALTEVRDLSVSDLLARAPIGLDPGRILGLVDDQTVLVTGAGGSIGSELCRQILQANPRRLVMLDRYENSLFRVQMELMASIAGAAGGVVAVIADITDATRLEQVFSRERPQVVFHAAAHKHVPLMETNPSEAVKNNVRGTRMVADAAIRWKTQRFVLISTDKAVNPSSVMGATKRLAERIVLKRSSESTAFITVRFGNVLGSNGSVVPRFIEQIKAGGPVTVTHPDMRRFFMLIPEAVQLVLHAAAVGRSGRVYVLDMGEQIRIADLARNLIRLTGFAPDQEIEIVYTGMRPGEKLSEQLVGHDEIVEPSGVEKVSCVAGPTYAADVELDLALEDLESLAFEGNDDAVLARLSLLVPTLNRCANTGDETEEVCKPRV